VVQKEEVRVMRIRIARTNGAGTGHEPADLPGIASVGGVVGVNLLAEGVIEAWYSMSETETVAQAVHKVSFAVLPLTGKYGAPPNVEVTLCRSGQSWTWTGDPPTDLGLGG
jgi:hypothetical protein